MSAPILSLRGLHAFYGLSHVLHGVDLDVGEGEIVALLGRNGVGRSTLCKAVMAIVERQGSIRVRGRETIGLEPHRVARLGLGYVPEERAVFPGLTVEQNLLLGRHGAASARSWQLEEVYELFPSLRRRSDTHAEVLSGGEQQMLSICRALMSGPELMIVDEPTEGLAPLIVEQVGDLLAEIARRGVAILLVEQKLTIAMRIAHRVYVMGHGRTVFEGSPDELRTDEAIRKAWLEV
ncbi:ABC transporter ATP-binding protein [Stappia taiwanensis]|nr:ABC transporter ATP-binding protein [Stappia taiwanensis]GGF00206.1 ABC transporter ATP-binding protein [Stappia taiwanensis]